jgi:hypothetical protein
MSNTPHAQARQKAGRLPPSMVDVSQVRSNPELLAGVNQLEAFARLIKCLPTIAERRRFCPSRCLSNPNQHG